MWFFSPLSWSEAVVIYEILSPPFKETWEKQEHVVTMPPSFLWKWSPHRILAAKRLFSVLVWVLTSSPVGRQEWKAELPFGLCRVVPAHVVQHPFLSEVSHVSHFGLVFEAQSSSAWGESSELYRSRRHYVPNSSHSGHHVGLGGSKSWSDVFPSHPEPTENFLFLPGEIR